MAITYKIMKTLTRPDGENKVRYEVFDSAGRKMIAPDWYGHEDEAFTAGQHIVKDGVLYRFLVPHTAETEWNSNEVTAVDVGEEIEAIVISLNGKIPTTAKGVANGVAELDSTGKVPAAQLPSYVDDVQEYSDKDHFPVTGSTGVIYVAIDTNKTYRWSGSAYVEISESLALGETSSTAFRGDHGKTAYDHATDANRLTTAQVEGLYKVSVSDEGHVKSVTAVQKEDITKLGIPAQDTTYSPATQSANGLMSSQDKTKLDGIDMSTKVNTSDFYATEMPVSESDSTKVATALSDIKSAVDGKADLIHDSVQNVAIASVPDAASNLPLTALRFAVEPIQDGSGDPYPGGGGKNILPTILADIKAANTSGTWEGNQYVFRGITYTFETDSAGNVTRVKAEGTAGPTIGVVDIGTYTYPAGTYILNGCPTKYGCMLYDGTSNIQDTGTGATFTFAEATEKTFKIRVAANTDLTTAVYFYPMVRLATVTDATFAPYSNIRPITGRTSAVVYQCGANLFEDSLTGKGINASGKITNSATNNLYLGQVKAGVTYTFSTGGGTFAYAFYTAKPQNEDVSYNGERTTTNTTFTAPIDGWVAVRLASDYASPMLVVGSTAPTEYTAHTGGPHTVQFGQDVYKGYVDWCEGVLALTHAVIDLGDMDRTWDISGVPNVSNAAIKSLVDIPSNNNVVVDMICDKYRTVSRNQMNDSAIETCCAVNYGGIFLVKDPACNGMTKEQVKTYLTGTKIVYPLATPIEISLTGLDEIKTPLNGGMMNLWADSGDVVLMEYPCDTKLFIEKKIAEMQALILENS